MQEFMKAVWPVLMLFVFIGCAPKEAPRTESSLESPSSLPDSGGDVAYAEEYRPASEQVERIAEMQLTFGMNTNHRTDDFINLLITGAQETASEYGIELLVSEAGFDANRQLGQIEDLIQQKVDAIFTVAVDSAAISSAILKTIRDRETGTLDAVGRSNMQMVSMQAVWTQDEALTAAENMIPANPDLWAIFATWSLAVNGALDGISHWPDTMPNVPDSRLWTTAIPTF